MQCRLAHNLGHAYVLEQRQKHASDIFKKLYTEQFRTDTKLDHCFTRLEQGISDYGQAFSGGVSGLTVKLNKYSVYHKIFV